MYGKLINNKLEIAPVDYIDKNNTILNFNTDESLMREYGYKPVIEAEKPSCPYIISYKETENEITEIVTIDATQNEANFKQEFFNTSLGWIRRQVNMKDGSTKDFLSDLLPAISMALNSGIATPIITYKTPDFTHDIIDWTIYQEIKQVTPQFIKECFDQLSVDFGAI